MGWGQNVIPIYRNSECTDHNITNGLIATLEGHFDKEVTEKDIVLYVCAVLLGQSYTEVFGAELSIPGIRVPITKDSNLFKK